MAGAVNAILASPVSLISLVETEGPTDASQVEMFKIRMQGQYGGAGDKKLGKVVGDVWRTYGLRDGIMRGYWVSTSLL